MKSLLIGMILLGSFSTYASSANNETPSYTLKIQSLEYQQVRDEIKALKIEAGKYHPESPKRTAIANKILDLDEYSDSLIDSFEIGNSDDISCVREVRKMDIWNGGCSQTVYFKNHLDEDKKGSYSDYVGESKNPIKVLVFRKLAFAKKCSEFRNNIEVNFKKCE